jgi:hypothetical protein
VDLSREDLEAGVKLRAWVEARPVARKRARSVATAFGWTRLTRKARTAIAAVARAVGLEFDPSITTCDADDWVVITSVGDPVTSDKPASQIVTWHSHNWTGSGDSGPTGEWLRCLRATRRGDRQFIWFDSQVAGVVTYAGWVRAGDGFYEGWGSVARLSRPVPRQALRDHGVTAARFDSRGIRGFQGSPIRLDPDVASAIGELAGGVPDTLVPLDDPDYQAESVLWAGLHGLGPEAHIEAAVASRRRFWRKLGFPHAPARQRILGTAGRADLIAGDVVGEAKRAVTLRDGPHQIERYLEYLETQARRPRQRLRGVLLQVAAEASDAVIERIETSRYRLELWHVDPHGRGRLRRLA